MKDSDCERQYLSDMGRYHICVIKPGGSACQGDSGGPLVCKDGGTWKLAGAASFVFGYCSTNKPSVYADVAYFRDWIKRTSGV